MSKKAMRILISLTTVVLIVSGCSFSTNSSSSKTSAGGNASSDNSIFASENNGDTWRPMVAISTANARPENISGLNISALSMDPQDSRAVYAGSYDHGLYYTYNITNGWNQVSGLPTDATINDVQVDPQNKCVIYAAIANRLYRSADCSRNWTQVYFDNNLGVQVTTIAIDHYNPRNIYIGTSRGEIIKSIDSGDAWRTIQRLEEEIARLVISPLDSRLLFVATIHNQVFSFNSNTDTNAVDPADLERNFVVENWWDMRGMLKNYDLGKNFKDLVICPKDGLVFLATDKMILRSNDNGSSWEDLKLIPPEQDAVIGAIAVNPQNSNDIYYVTNTTFYRTLDGGTSWTTKNLPTKRAGRFLLIDFKNPNILYLGTVKLKD